jgi:hypothetical protein
MVTIVIVVSFMVAGPFSLGSVIVRFDRTRGPDLIGRRARSADSVRTLPEHGPHVCDVVLPNGHREHLHAMFRLRAAAAEDLHVR